MLPDQTIGQGALDPPLVVVATNPDGSAIDLTGATNVQFRVKPANGCRAASVTTGTVVDAKGGAASHDWVAVEVQAPGLLLVQLTWTDTDSKPQTWPLADYVRVRVTPRL